MAESVSIIVNVCFDMRKDRCGLQPGREGCHYPVFLLTEPFQICQDIIPTLVFSNLRFLHTQEQDETGKTLLKVLDFYSREYRGRDTCCFPGSFLLSRLFRLFFFLPLPLPSGALPLDFGCSLSTGSFCSWQLWMVQGLRWAGWDHTLVCCKWALHQELSSFFT